MDAVGSAPPEPVVEGNHDACVVVPMYNEGRVISGVIRDLRVCFADIVCVDDGSIDDSVARAAEAGARVVRHGANFGQGAALQTGIELALRRGDVDYVITFDADGQHRVADAVAMLDFARHGACDVVLGSRFLRHGATVPWRRRQLLRAAVAFTRLTTGLPLTDAHNGLRVLRRGVAASLDIRLNGMAHASEILGRIAHDGWVVSEFPVTVDYTDYSRAKGQTGLNAVNIAFDLAVARARVSS